MNGLFLSATEEFFFWLLIVPLVLIFSLAIVAVVIRIAKMAKMNKEQSSIIASQGIDIEQQKQFVEAYGGKDNIVLVTRNMTRLTIEVKDVEKVNADALQTLGASGILISGNIIKASFKDRTPYVYDLMK